MCGIVGKMGNISFDEVEKLLLASQVRGSDATGIWFNNGFFLKKGLPAKEFIKEFKNEIIKEMPLQGIFIGHTRAVTDGPASNNENNHPFVSQNYALVHNGKVANGNIPGYAYRGKCDSEKILSLLETQGFDGLKEVMGSAAIAFQKLSDMSSLYLWRNFSSPMVLGYNENENGLFFASTQEIMSSICQLVLGFFRKSDMLIQELPDFALYKITIGTPHKITFVGEFKKVYSGYQEQWYGSRYQMGYQYGESEYETVAEKHTTLKGAQSLTTIKPTEITNTSPESCRKYFGRVFS